MKLSRLTPGQLVWEIKRSKKGSIRYNECYTIKILSIDLQEDSILASYNGNPPQTFKYEDCKYWKIRQPKPKKILDSDILSY